MANEEKGVIRTISKMHLQKAEEVTWNSTKGSADISSAKEIKVYAKGGIELKEYEEVNNKAIIDEIGVAENIIVIGPQMYQHDSLLRGLIARWDAGPNAKFMFMHQAMRKIFLNPEINWTVITYSTGYSKEQIAAMEMAILNRVNACTFVTVNGYDHVYNYINSMNLNDWSGNVSEIRKKNQIRRVHFYCHGLVFRLAMGITNHNEIDGDLDITTGNVGKLKEEAFEPGAKIYSFSCRTGLGNEEISQSAYYDEKVSTGLFTSKIVRRQYNLYSAQSLAQKMANATGATVYAYLRRSEYSDTLNTADELDFMDAYEAGIYGKKRERPIKEYDRLLDKRNTNSADIDRYQLLKEEKRGRKKIGKAMFDSNGAKYPVRAALSPEGLPDDMKTFTKK